MVDVPNCPSVVCADEYWENQWRVSSTASNSRQLVCHCCQGSIQEPKTACLLHTVPQPILEASTVTAKCLHTCSKCTPASQNARPNQGLERHQQIRIKHTQSMLQHHAHLRTCYLICNNPSGITVAADAIFPRSLWNCFRGTAVFPLNKFRQFSSDWPCLLVRVQLHTVKRDTLANEAISYEEKKNWMSGCMPPTYISICTWGGLACKFHSLINSHWLFLVMLRGDSNISIDIMSNMTDLKGNIYIYISISLSA